MIYIASKKIRNNLWKNNKSILKTQQRFISEKHKIFTEEINKIALSSDDDKRMQSIDSIENICVWKKWRSSKCKRID